MLAGTLACRLPARAGRAAAAAVAEVNAQMPGSRTYVLATGFIRLDFVPMETGLKGNLFAGCPRSPL